MIGQVQATDERVVRLPDGRSLGYAQYGDPNGFPIVNAHGGMACRLDVAAAAPVANQVGVAHFTRPTGRRPVRPAARPHRSRLGARCRRPARPSRRRPVRRHGVVDGWAVRGRGRSRAAAPGDTGGDHRRRVAAHRSGQVRAAAVDGPRVDPDVAAHALAGTAVLRVDAVDGADRTHLVRPLRRARVGTGGRCGHPRRGISPPSPG